jgi:hypothetical protein
VVVDGELATRSQTRRGGIPTVPQRHGQGQHSAEDDTKAKSVAWHNTEALLC